MRKYADDQERIIRVKRLADEWLASGLIDATQHERIAAGLQVDLRRTNRFLRLTLFGFGLLIIGAAVGLVVVTFDVERLSRAFSRHQLFLPVQRVNVLDTLQGAAWYFQRLQLLLPAQRPEDFKLSTLAKFFKIDAAGAHDALVDVRLSIALARRFIS